MIIKIILCILAYVVGIVITYISNGWFEFAEKYNASDCGEWLPNYIRYSRSGDWKNETDIYLACLFWFIFWIGYIPYKIAIIGNAKLNTLKENKILRLQNEEKIRISAQNEVRKYVAELDQEMNILQVKEKQS